MENPLGNAILTFLHSNKSPSRLDDIIQALEPAGKKNIQKKIAEKIKRGDIIEVDSNFFKIAENRQFFSGILEKHPHGFGFVTQLLPKKGAQGFQKDPFLSIKNIGSANHGDTIFIRVYNVRRDGRPEAELIGILKRGAETLVGFFKNGKPPLVIAEDPRFPTPIQLTGYKEKIEENTVVLVKILPATGKDSNTLQGELVEIFGAADNVDVQMRIVIEKHALPHIFNDQTLAEAEQCAILSQDSEKRLDLRTTCHITIDGETAKDFDDAIAVEKNRKGYRLYVSIADVSHFVKPGSSLDKEAYERGTSVYFPGRVIPMLPENLSNNLCSLVPQEDRLTFTAILDFDRQGNLLKKDFSKSVICSKHRFTYTTVKEILIDKNAQVRREHKPFLTPLKWAHELASQLMDKRMAHGALGFTIPEPEITLNDTGKISAITRRERNFAHQIIEEFMLAANQAVAELFSQNACAFLYRIHEKPTLAKIEEFKNFAKSIGLDLPASTEEPEPKWFAEVLQKSQNSPVAYVVNNLLLRTMQQARYSPDNQGHFGLAASDYTHFTSPIRRYPDLVVHRLLFAFIHENKKRSQILALDEIGEHCSTRERIAISADREMNDRLKVFFMEQHIGESFAGIISGVIEGTLFIELIDTFISGAIDISLLRDDYYLFDSKRHRFIGEIKGKTYALGDSIDVKLIDVNLRSRRISFAPADMFF